MATFTVTTDTNYSSLAGVADGDIVNISQGAIFTVNTNTVRMQTIDCSSLGQIKIENTSTTTPIFINMGNNASFNGTLRVQGGARLDVLGNWITIGTSNGSASQTFALPTNGGQQYSRLGGVWVNGAWWPCVTALTDYDSDETGQVCVHNTTSNQIEFGNGTAGAIPANSATIRVPNIQIRYNDTANTARSINIDLYTTGTAYLRQCALDGYIGASSTTDFFAQASQWDWDRVCMDVGGSNNTNLRWSWDSPDADSSMTDVCFSRMLGSTREFQMLSTASKYSMTRVTYISNVAQNPSFSGNNSRFIDCKFIVPSTTVSNNFTFSGRRSYLKGIRMLNRGALIVSGTESVVEDIRLSHRVTRTSTTAAVANSIQITGESCTLNGMTDWKSSNRMFNPASNAGILSVTNLNSQVFNVYDIGDTTSTQGRLILTSGRGVKLHDVSVIDNAPRGNIVPSSANQKMRNVFTTDTSVVTDTNATFNLMNDADLEYVMANFRVLATRTLNGVSTASQSRYIGLTTNGVGSDISDVLMLRGDIGRTGGMILLMFGQEKTREYYEPSPSNTGEVLFDNAGKIYIENDNDSAIITGRQHFGILSWGDILLDGTNPTLFTIEFRAKEGSGSYGDWYILSTENLTTATSGFSNMSENGVTLQYKITHDASNLSDNLNLVEIRCTTSGTYVMPYTVEDVYSSGDYTLHRKLDMSHCTIEGTLTFTVAGTYSIDNCTISAVANTSGGSVTIIPSVTTSITTNSGPNITISSPSATLTVDSVVTGSDVVFYDRTVTPDGTGNNFLQISDSIGQ